MSAYIYFQLQAEQDTAQLCQEIPESNYSTSTTSIVASHSLWQHFCMPTDVTC